MTSTIFIKKVEHVYANDGIYAWILISWPFYFLYSKSNSHLYEGVRGRNILVLFRRNFGTWAFCPWPYALQMHLCDQLLWDQVRLYRGHSYPKNTEEIKYVRFEAQTWMETHGNTSDVSTPPFWKKLNSSGCLTYSTSDLVFIINDNSRMKIEEYSLIACSFKD